VRISLYSVFTQISTAITSASYFLSKYNFAGLRLSDYICICHTDKKNCSNSHGESK